MNTRNQIKQATSAKIAIAMIVASVTISLLLFTLCNKGDDVENSKVRFYLTDAPSMEGYKQVNIDLLSVSYSLDGQKWQELSITPGIYDLMMLTRGQSSLLSTIELDKGEYIKQVRLKLGDRNSVMLADSSVHELFIPGGESSGYKINIRDSVVTHSTYSIMIDFDAERSVVRRGNSDNFLLKPVVRGYISQNTSYVEGKIIPDSIPYHVCALFNNDTICCISDTSCSNRFFIQGLHSGDWRLQFKDTSDILLKTISVSVVGGINKNLGNIDLRPQ